MQMEGLPRHLPVEFTGEVRGEAYMLVKDFDEVNAILEEEGEDTYMNPRNAAAGILRSTDGRFSERLKFVAHGINDPAGGLCIANHRRAYAAMKLLGFAVVDHFYCESVEQAIDFWLEVRRMRPTLGFWIDGTMWLVDGLPQYEAMGVTHNRPKGAIAFKFESEEAETILNRLVTTVGHTGKLTPTAEFDGISLGGANVTNAQLFNWDYMATMNLGLGDLIVVSKAGDIIPHVERVVAKGPVETRLLITAPTTCPVCQGRVAKNLTSKGKPTVDINLGPCGHQAGYLCIAPEHCRIMQCRAVEVAPALMVWVRPFSQQQIHDGPLIVEHRLIQEGEPGRVFPSDERRISPNVLRHEADIPCPDGGHGGDPRRTRRPAASRQQYDETACEHPIDCHA